MIRLNLGCGSVRLDGYVNVDAHTACDLMDDIQTLSKVPSASADEVLADHSLEHVGRFRFEDAVLAWRRVLKPGGKIAIGVPDIAGLARALADADAAGDDRAVAHHLKGVYGNQCGPGEFHRWGFTERTLRGPLEKAGFEHIRIRKCESHGAPSLIATAVVPGGTDAPEQP